MEDNVYVCNGCFNGFAYLLPFFQLLLAYLLCHAHLVDGTDGGSDGYKLFTAYKDEL